MYVILDNESDIPIYEQIKDEIRRQIFNGNLTEGEMLPSIRTLARELKIGIITAKHAYDDLCAEGFLYPVQGKGIFVAECNKQKADDYALNEIRLRLYAIADYAEKNSVDKNKLRELIEKFAEERL